MPASPVASVLIVAIGLIFLLAFLVSFGASRKEPTRQERRSVHDSNLYMTRLITNATQIRHIQFFEDGVSIPDISFDGRLEFVETPNVNHAYIEGIEAALRDLRLHPTNPVWLYTASIKPSPAAGLFVLGAINAYRTKLVHVIQFYWDGEKLTEVYDSTRDGEYTSHMLTEDVKRIIPPSSISWQGDTHLA